MLSGAIEVNVRAASPDDDEFILALAEAANVKVSPARERELAHSCLLVAELSGDLKGSRVGFALGWIVAGEIELLDVVVSEQARRQGIAARLLGALFERGRGKDAAVAFLEVRAGNHPAQALYRKLGFSEVGRRMRYYPDGEDALLFRCCFSQGD